MEPGFQVFGPGFGQSCDWGWSGCGGGVAYSNDDDRVSGKPGGPALGSVGSTVSLYIDSFGGYNCYYYCIPVDWAGQYTLVVGQGLASEGLTFTLTVQDVTSDGNRVGNLGIPGLYDLHLDHLVKKPKHAPASFARKWVASRI